MYEKTRVFYLRLLYILSWRLNAPSNYAQTIKLFLNCLFFIHSNRPHFEDSKLFLSLHHLFILIHTRKLCYIEAPTSECVDIPGYIHQFLVTFIIMDINMSVYQNQINSPSNILKKEFRTLHTMGID